jgi:hypothetical protein
VKSLSETQPDLGLASASVDVQLYVDGRAQVSEDIDVVKVVSAVVVTEAFVGLAEVTPGNTTNNIAANEIYIMMIDY